MPEQENLPGIFCHYFRTLLYQVGGVEMTSIDFHAVGAVGRAIKNAAERTGDGMRRFVPCCHGDGAMTTKEIVAAKGVAIAEIVICAGALEPIGLADMGRIGDIDLDRGGVA